MAISLILGDGVYNLIKIITVSVKEICTKKHINLPTMMEVTGRLIYPYLILQLVYAVY